MIPYDRQDVLGPSIPTVADDLRSVLLAHGSVVPVLEEGVASL